MYFFYILISVAILREYTLVLCPETVHCWSFKIAGIYRIDVEPKSQLEQQSSEDPNATADRRRRCFRA